MMNECRWSRFFLPASCFALAALVLLAGQASACPTCKENLAHDPASANLARGFYYSILFMLSMPPLIFGGLSAYFFWEVRKARAREAAKAADETKLAIQA